MLPKYFYVGLPRADYDRRPRVTENLVTTDPIIRISAGAPTPFIADVDDGAVPLIGVGSTGISQIEPLAIATTGDTTVFYPQCSPTAVADLSRRLAAGDDATNQAEWVVRHQPQPRRLPIPTEGPLAVGSRDILGLCGWLRPTAGDDYRAAMGFTEPDRIDVQSQLTGLQGRGWGDIATDIPLTDIWRDIQEQSDDPVLVVNAHSNQTDHLLLESIPLAVLDGARVTAGAINATEIIIYTSDTADMPLQHTKAAIAELPRGPPVTTATGPTEYRAGEPTMALEALEGVSRIEARRRPPSPAEVGLNERPTAIHTPRTLVQLLATIHSPDRQPTRLLRYTGDVAAPAVVELPETATLEDGLGAVAPTGPIKAAAVGGQFGGFTADLDIQAHPGALGDADLGTDGRVEILTTDRCVVAEIGRRARTASETNCGRCVPCREGTTQLVGLLRAVYDGEVQAEKIQELCRVMDTTSLCAFGVQAARSVRTGLAGFQSEFTAHANGTCPAGVCYHTTVPENHRVSS